jgi:hypothetical protein
MAQLLNKPISLTDYLNGDMVSEICRYLDGYSIARCARVNIKWHKLLTTESSWLWEEVCNNSFHPGAIKRAYKQYALDKFLDWRKQFMKTLHVRLDGMYVLRVSYMAPGSNDRSRAPNVISYFRYLRFFPKGKVLYALLNYDSDVTTPWFSQFGPDGPKFAVTAIEGKKSKVSGNMSNLNSGATMTAGIAPGSAHSSIPPTAIERIRYGRYKVSNGTVTCTVDIGHMVITLRLSFNNIIENSNDRLELSSFTGRQGNEEDGNAAEFPSPNPWFRFERVVW